jgi:predicted Ser/Thr protein kinase
MSQSGDDPLDLGASRPPDPAGVVRRLGQGLLSARLFGAPLPRFGRFVVHKKLGEGGMGAVFLAEDSDLGRPVAIKLLRQAGGRGLGHEARMLARLSHPNVVTVYELGEVEGERYVNMAYVDGPNLAAWMVHHPTAGWRERLGLLREAIRGLSAAHRAGVIHRDFKLENVLVGSDGVPRVTDFGLARTGAEGPTAGAEPGVGTGLVGTPGYIAPEVLAGAAASERSDQYAVAVSLRLALGGAPDAPPNALRRVLARAGAADPALRFDSLDALVGALDAAATPREPVRAVGPPTPEARAREVLLGRVARMWIEPLRERVLGVAGELPLRTEPIGAVGPGGLDLGDGGAAAIAEALTRLGARVALVGAPGGGKTLRLLAVAEALLQAARSDPEAPLPVVLPLSSLSTRAADLPGWVQQELVARYALPRDQVEAWIAAGALALLLDGLDEVPPADRARCVALLDATPRPFACLLTCREDAWMALNPRPRHDAALRLGSLGDETIEGALLRAGVTAARRAWIHEDPALAEALRSPLLLSLFLELPAEAPAAGQGDLRERLYARALDHALERPPAVMGPARARLTVQVQALAALLERAGVSGLWLEDMQVGWLPGRRARGLAYALGLGPVYLLSLLVNLGASRLAQLPWASGLFFGLLAPTAALVIHGGAWVAPMERMGWSWARVRQWIPRLLALGLVTGGLHGLFYDLWADLILGLATGLLGVSVIGLVPAGRERRATPGSGLWESARTSLRVAPLIGLIIGAPVGYFVLPFAAPLAEAGSMYHTHPDPARAWALTMGTSAMVTSLFITGMLAPALHLGLRGALALCTPLPLALGDWAEALAERGLLRRVGGGWVFRHATLRAWLARQAAAQRGG